MSLNTGLAGLSCGKARGLFMMLSNVSSRLRPCTATALRLRNPRAQQGRGAQRNGKLTLNGVVPNASS